MEIQPLEYPLNFIHLNEAYKAVAANTCTNVFNVKNTLLNAKSIQIKSKIANDLIENL